MYFKHYFFKWLIYKSSIMQGLAQMFDTLKPFSRVTRKLYPLLLAACFILPVAHAQDNARTDIVNQPHLDAQMLSEVDSVQPGESFWVAIKLIPDDGWHTYWINPGDSGLSTQINWQLGDGVSAGDIVWPVAQKYRIGPLANYGFEDTTYLLTEIHLDDDYSDSELRLENRVDWLVCEEYCIPGYAEFTLTLPVSSSAAQINEQNADSFAEARANLPETADWPAYFDVQGNNVTILIEHPDAVAMASDSDFYTYIGAGELVEHAESGDVEIADDSVIVRRTRNTYFSGVDSSFPLLLSNSERAVLLTAQSSDGTAPGSAVSTGSVSGTDTGISLASVLLFALLGGLILNLMPCVFPVLSLKALAVANSGDRKLADALWYTLGVILTFMAFAAVLLALRASGEALGWGFQLQNPWLIAVLSVLFVAIGLNLSGIFQFGTKITQLANMTSQPAAGGAKGSFATGVLAVIIASPCTAPFMGIALGFAIIQPVPIALLIFATLGLGLALPFILLGLVPGLSRFLPRPGPWMDTFKQWLAIPMYLTTVWLLWVFARQAGVDSQAILLVALVLFTTALWWYGKRQLQSRKSISGTVWLSILFALSVVTLYAALNMQQTSTQNDSGDTARQWQTWSAERLAEARQDGPVFVNMTADWCITCLANERVALETQSTRELFASHDILYLKGDWTLQDPAITEYLADYGRNGVPLYVLYWPGEDPVVLPQILTNTIIRERVETFTH